MTAGIGRVAPVGTNQGHSRTAGPRAARWVRWVLAALVALQLWSAMSSALTSAASLVRVAALLSGVLAVFGLPSLPPRVLVWLSTGVSAVLLVRFGTTGIVGGLASMMRPLLWLSATGIALTVTAPPRQRERWTVLAPALGSVLAALGVVAGMALTVGPRLAGSLETGSTIGETVDLSDNHAGNPLDSSSTLDMTTRPQLSDRVVLTVDSPVASFWRSEIYDVWNGARWSRSAGRGGAMLSDGTVVPPPEDLAGSNGESFESEMRVEVGFATALPGAPSVVKVSAEGHQLAQRTDGSVVAFDGPLGRGATYRVTSRRVPLDEQRLRELGSRGVPTGVAVQYAQQPVASGRTIELAERVTRGLDSNYDRILALEAWMGDNTRYDIQAPLSPAGVDVVDHFLFESQLGWCEQIASSLVVMARSVGIPARLATGYTPGEWDAVTRRFIVRELHAHSWAEVWFPEAGWVPFDPTADVPLSGSAEGFRNGGATGSSDVIGLVLLGLAVAVVAIPRVLRLSRRGIDRVASLRARRRLLATRWDVRDEESIEAAGKLLGHQRGPSTTLSSYADHLVTVGGDADLTSRAQRIEQYRYGESSPPGGS